MKETGLMFKAPLVRAILSGQKTQTRRVIKNQPFDRGAARGDHRMAYVSGRAEAGDEVDGLFAYTQSSGGEWTAKCPVGQPGDHIYVRETFARVPTVCGSDELVFAADYQDGSDKAAGVKYTPAIHMRKSDARIWLNITGVRVERLQAISEADVEAEGIDFLRSVPDVDETLTAKQLFECLWGSTGGDWAANPWVWVIDFKRIDKPAPKEAP